MDKKNKDFLYFKICLNNIIQSSCVLCLLTIFEFLTIYSNLIISVDSVIDRKEYNKSNEQEDDALFYISLYNIIKRAIGKKRIWNFFFLGQAIFFFIIYSPIKLTLTEKITESESKLCSFYKTFITNLYEVFIFRVISIYFIDPYIFYIIYTIQNCFSNKDTTLNYVYIVLLIIALMLFTLWTIRHQRHFSVWSNMHYIKGECKNYPYTIGFGFRYDVLMIGMKIMISIVTNTKIIFEYEQSKDFLFFVNCIMLLILFQTFCITVYELRIHHDTFLYYNYSNMIITKMFLLSFGFASVVIKFFLFERVYMITYPILGIALIFFIIVFYFNFKTFILAKLTSSSSYLGVLVFLLSNDIDSNEAMRKWVIHHKLTCKNKLCTICISLNTLNTINSNGTTTNDANAKNETSLHKIPFNYYYHLIFAEIQNQLRRGRFVILHHHVLYLEMVEIFDYLLTNRTQRIVFFVLFFRLVAKYKQYDTMLRNNLIILFDFINKGNEDFIKSYNEFIQSESLLSLITKFVDEYEHFILYEQKTPDNVVSIAKKFNELTKNSDAIRFLTSNPCRNYQLIILRYLYETVVHAPLPGNHEFFDIAIYGDFLDFHYKNDRMVLIKYSLMGNTTLILQAGGDLKNMTNKPLESIFPRYLKNYGISKFIEFINLNNFKDANNIFEFIITNVTNEGDFIESFKLNYVLYPSVETDEMIITGDYLMAYDDIIVFCRQGRKDFLFSFSSAMEKLFGFPPSFFRDLRINGKTFSFSSLFKKKKGMRFSTVTNQNENIYEFLTGKYIGMLSDFLEDSSIDKETMVKLHEIQHFSQKCTERELRLEKKYSISVDDAVYVIFFVKSDEFKLKGKKKDVSLTKAILDTNNPYTNAYGTGANTNMNNTFHFGTTMDSMSVSCSSSISSTSGTYATKIKMKKISTIEKSGIKNINLYVRLISSFLILLVAISLLFLSLEVNQDKHFESLFFLFEKFKYYKRGIEMQPVRLFSNICIRYPENYATNTTQCLNYYSFFSQLVQSQVPSMTGLPLINQVIYDEFVTSMDVIQDALVEFQKEALNLNIKELQDIYNYTNWLYNLEEDENGTLNTIFIEYTFFDCLKVYHNYFSQIIQSGNLMTTPIKFINYDTQKNQVDKSTLSYEDIQGIAVFIYQAIINYPLVHKTIIDVQDMIESGFEKFLNNMENIIIIFCIILYVFHLILAIICFKFISSYKKVVHQNFSKVIDIVTSPIYQNYIHSIIVNVRELKMLYEEKPSAIAAKITKEKENYKKQKKEELKQIQSNMNNHKSTSSIISTSSVQQTNRNISSNKLSLYSSIVFEYQKILYILFLMYIAIITIIFIVLFINLQKLKSLVEYTKINANLDNYIYDNINANQYILMTNVSSSLLSYLMYSNVTINYIKNGISQHYVHMKEYEQFMDKHKNYKMLQDIVDISCSNLPSLNDSAIFYVKKELDIDLSEFITNFCDLHLIITYNKPILIQKEILYLMQSITQVDYLVPYEQKFNLLSMKEIYSMYNISLFLNNILRNYVNDKLIPDMVQTISGQFQTAVIVCLVINCLCDVIIAIVLMLLVMRRMIAMNKVFTKFMKFLD